MELTEFSPLEQNYPKLPPGKYGVFVCSVCKKNKASRWHEQTLMKLCFECIFDKMNNNEK